MIEALVPVLFNLLLIGAEGPQQTLMFCPADKVWPGDSIPDIADERIVLWANNIQAHWVVVLVNLSYEQSHAQIRELVHEAFGIESAGELTASVQAGKPVDPGMPMEPLFGDGFGDFHAIGVPFTETREYRIRSKPYNNQLKRKSYSEAQWRIIDGSLLFDKACTLLVVSRTDHSREWAWMHPGIPLPFKVTGDTKLVTDREMTLVETFVESNGYPYTRYFVPNTVYKANGVLDLMTAIRKAAQELSETGTKQSDS